MGNDTKIFFDKQYRSHLGKQIKVGYLLICIAIFSIFSVVLLDVLFYDKDAYVFWIALTLGIVIPAGWVVIYLLLEVSIPKFNRMRFAQKTENAKKREIQGILKEISGSRYTINRFPCRRLTVIEAGIEREIYIMESFVISDEQVGQLLSFEVLDSIAVSYRKERVT